jgi:hypothetical protein
VLFLRDFFKGDYAAELVAVLPEWIRFLAEQNGTASDLTERCLEYASGDLQSLESSTPTANRTPWLG